MCAGNHAHGFTFNYPVGRGREEPFYIYAFGLAYAGTEQLLMADRLGECPIRPTSKQRHAQQKSSRV